MILQQAIEHYGVESQLNKVDEELRELLIALKKWRRDKSKINELTDEIADVKNMLPQLIMILSKHYEVDFNVLIDERINFKLNRLKQRIEDDKNRTGV